MAPPGVFSARYAGTHGDAEGNMTKLLAELERVGATNASIQKSTISHSHTPKSSNAPFA